MHRDTSRSAKRDCSAAKWNAAQCPTRFDSEWLLRETILFALTHYRGWCELPNRFAGSTMLSATLRWPHRSGHSEKTPPRDYNEHLHSRAGTRSLCANERWRRRALLSAPARSQDRNGLGRG